MNNISVNKRMIISFCILAFLINSCGLKRYDYVELMPKSIDLARKEKLYEYSATDFRYYKAFEKDGKNIYFSNVKPDVFKEKKYPLKITSGELIPKASERIIGSNLKNNKSDAVERYFNKLNGTKVYYHFRNDSLISRLFLIENTRFKGNKKITTRGEVLNLLDSLKINYIVSNENEKKILIENKYPTYIFASHNLFYIEVYYKQDKTLDYNLSLH